MIRKIAVKTLTKSFSSPEAFQTVKKMTMTKPTSKSFSLPETIVKKTALTKLTSKSFSLPEAFKRKTERQQ